ncbi:MAG: ABC transporter permease subunit [Lachnospiraceae bacterium]|nr:ABC transporter permease subunit [Lachnospiraceae bacterium]
MKNQKKRKIRWGKTLTIYAMMLPALVYFLINNYLPMFGIIIAFKNVNYSKGILASDWCGFDNFKFLFASGNAWRITRNTVLYNVAFIILGMVLGITVAILMNEIRGKIPLRIYQTLILLPYLMSWVVVSYLCYAFLSSETGFINNTILPLLGIDKTIAFYQQQKYWPFILTFVNLWKNMGFNMIMYYSCIIGIPGDYYEAARVDGASKWQQIKSVTLPCLKPTIVTLLILNIGKMFYSDFGLFYQVPKNSGLLYNVTQTIDTYVYNALMTQNNIGMSAAAGFYQSIVGFALVLITNMIIRKIDRENAMF